MKKRYFFLFILFISAVYNLSYAQHLVIQAEAGTYASTTKVESEYAGYTGSGYINTANAVGAYLEIEFSVKNGGADTIFIFYGMSKTDDRSANVLLNNVKIIDSLAFPSTGAYTTWKAVSFVADLAKGTNKIRLVARSANGLTNIDRFEISDEQGVMQYQLTTNISGKGTITRDPNSLYYDAGTVVTLTAVPDAASASIFLGWTGDATGTNPTATVTMSAAKTVTASFKSTIHGNYYISPSGSDATGDGSKANPFYTLQKAVDLVNAGDSIICAGGTYNYTARVNIGAVGSADEMITLTSAKGEHAVFDFSGMADDDANQGMRLTGSYWHFYNFDIKGAGDNGLLIERNKPTGGSYADVVGLTDQAHDNLIELCNFYENRDAGLQMKNMATYNKIINCDSYYNRDATDGDADGFAPKLTVGTGNYFWGCRSWQNSDDGWDLYLKCTEDNFPDDMTTVIENCWTAMNGFYKTGAEGSGNGNGFKLGGSSGKDQRHNAILRRCLSFDNLQKGFDQNNNTGNMTMLNCTGFAKAYVSNSSHFTYRFDGSTLASGKAITATNCISIGDGLPRKTSAYAECELLSATITSCDWLATADDFVSIDTTGFRGARKADGSLPDINFMHLKATNTKYIDKGVLADGIKYVGTAPDMGCFEYGMSTDVKTDKPVLATKYVLAQNFPNPFNPTTRIQFSVPATENVSLKVYDVLGNEIATLINEEKASGTYNVVWNGADNFGRKVTSGIYFYQLKTPNYSETRKMIMMK